MNSRLAERAAAFALVLSAIYFAAHILAAWLRGSFHLVVTR